MDGDSRVTHLVQSDSLFECSYILGKKFRYPYVGFYLFPPKENDSTLDISQYDKMSVEINPEKTAGMTIILRLFMDGISRWDEHSSWYYLEGAIPFKPDTSIFTFSLEDMRPPDWWYSINDYSEDKEYKRNYHQMGIIAIGNHETTAFPVNLEKEFSMDIKEIRFSKNKMRSMSIPLLLLSIYFVIVLIVVIVNKRRYSINYVPTNLKSSAHNDLEKVLSIINQNYSKQLFVIKDIEDECGISKNTIRSLIHSNYKLSFKEYLTKIRMSEAKRLLVETDCNISEIAFAVGYQHATTFSRIFREEIGSTPTQYRSKLSCS